MKKTLIVISKVLLFACITIWILGMLATTIAVVPGYAEYLEGEGVEEGTVLMNAMIGWLLITTMLVAIWAALKGFMAIGKWEPKEEAEEETEEGDYSAP